MLYLPLMWVGDTTFLLLLTKVKDSSWHFFNKQQRTPRNMVNLGEIQM